jgi:excisionase family DNA binding protein
VASSELLTIPEVAKRLDVARSIARMLVESGKLGPVTTKDGRLRVAAEAVEAYVQARALQLAGAKSPREAAVDANLYGDIPVSTLRTFAKISDPANRHLFTREALKKALANVAKKKRPG